MNKTIDFKKLSIITGILLLVCGVFALILKTNKIKTISFNTKGVLNINTNKSNYYPGETVSISISSFDDSGNTICNSNLKLEIIDQEKLSTNLDINRSPTCGNNNITNDPDYTASRILEKVGGYKLILTNIDTKKTVETSIKVSTDSPISIQRSSATRINPTEQNRYPMIITIKANKDFSGKISDTLPESFSFIWFGGGKVTSDNKGSTISWDIKLKKGESIDLKYEYIPSKDSQKIKAIEEIILSINSKVSKENIWTVVTQGI